MAKHGTMQKVVLGTLAVMMVASLLLAVAALILPMSGQAVVDLRPVHATACGTTYLYQWLCNQQCEDIGTCPGGVPLRECYWDKMERRANPMSDKFLYTYKLRRGCGLDDNWCPACN